MDIILIIGLPGSGKTTFINNNYKNKCDFKIFDDFKANAINNNSDFYKSRYYSDISKIINNESKDIVISDIDFCDFEQFKDAVCKLKQLITRSTSEYIIKAKIFKNNLRQCKENIRNDNSNNMEDRIKKAKEYSDKYHPKKIKKELKDNAEIIEVYSGY